MLASDTSRASIEQWHVVTALTDHKHTQLASSQAHEPRTEELRMFGLTHVEGVSESQSHKAGV